MSQPARNKKQIALTVLAFLTGAAFIFFGALKLSGAEQMVANFARWGFPGWFVYLTGALEVSAGLALFIPRLRFFAGAILAGVTVGAAATHLVFSDGLSQTAPSLVFLALSMVQAYANRGTLRRLLGRNSPAEVQTEG